MNIQSVLGFIGQHKEAFGLFGLAMAVTMRPRLPWPFSLIEPLEWSYEWLRDGLLTFVSMRGPSHSEASQKIDTKIVKDDHGKVTELSSSTVNATAETPEEKHP